MIFTHQKVRDLHIEVICMSLTNPFGIKEKEIKRIIKECCPDKSEFYSLDASQCFNTKSECIVPSELTSTEANL